MGWTDKLGNREDIKCMVLYQIVHPYREGENKGRVWPSWKWDTGTVANKAQ